MVRMASTSSASFIEPICAAKAEPERPATNTEGYRTLVIVARWMSAMVISHTNDSMLQAINGTERQPHDQQRSINVRDALGLLASAHLLAVAGGDGMLEVVANPNTLRTLTCGALATLHG